MNDVKEIIKKEAISLANNTDSFLSEKIEKIIMAIYMVTDFFPKEDPLKLKIREKNLELMSFIMSFRNFEKRDNSYRLILLVSEIKSLLKIALVAKSISKMNYTILFQEYKKIIDFVEKKNSQNERFILLEEFFKEDEKDEKISEEKRVTEKISKGQIPSKGHLENLKDIKKSKGQIKKKARKRNPELKESREQAIIKFIKDKKEVSIKDIIKVIKNCSEKTIQRDLVNMVNSGVLKKEGERRWSRYSIGSGK